MRTLTYHPAYKRTDCPAVLIGSYKLLKSLNWWRIGEKVEVIIQNDEIIIRKVGDKQ